MASDLVTVTWQGPFDGELPDGRRVARGDQLQVHAHEADSPHYKLVKPASKTRSASSDSHDGGDS